MSKRRMRAKAEADVQESIEQIEAYNQDLEELRVEMEEALEAVEEKWADIVEDVTEIGVSPYKKDIDVTLFGTAWMPYYLVQMGDDVEELAAFESAA